MDDYAGAGGRVIGDAGGGPAEETGPGAGMGQGGDSPPADDPGELDSAEAAPARERRAGQRRQLIENAHQRAYTPWVRSSGRSTEEGRGPWDC